MFLGEIPDNLFANDEYTPIILVNVERSFSVYKSLLANNRRSMLVRKSKVCSCIIMEQFIIYK